MFSTVLICKYQMRIQSSPDMHSVAHCASAITVDTLFHHPPHRPANLPAAIALPQMGLDLTRNIELVLLTYNNTANRAFSFSFSSEVWNNLRYAMHTNCSLTCTLPGNCKLASWCIRELWAFEGMKWHCTASGCPNVLHWDTERERDKEEESGIEREREKWLSTAN